MIRLAQANDLRDIKACAELAYARYVPVIGRKPAPMVADFSAQIAAGKIFVATNDQATFQGFIVFYAEHEHMLLENVAVLPSAAGRGVGRALINFCEHTARHQRMKAVHLYTNAKMTENLAIYTKLGYVKVGQRIEEGFERVFFEKSVF